MPVNQRFGKEYKLCSKIIIDAMFVDRKVVKSYPLLLNYQIQEFSDSVPFKVVITAPKRSFKRAVDRNHIKRLMKEVLRKNKAQLEEFLLQYDKKLALFLIYTGKEIPTYHLLERKIVVVLERLITELKKEFSSEVTSIEIK